MELYQKIVFLIRDYMKEKDYKTLFLSGGCYWFANEVANWVPNTCLMINHSTQHCAVMIGQHLYDITGCISKKGFHMANDREISFMRKNYQPEENLSGLDSYVKKHMRVYIAQLRENAKLCMNCDN